jgi:hypothetical protein
MTDEYADLKARLQALGVISGYHAITAIEALQARVAELEELLDGDLTAVYLAGRRDWSTQNQKLEAENARLRTVHGAAWQPIETAPKDGTTVLLIDRRVGGGHPFAAAWVEQNGCALWKDSEGVNGFFDGFFTDWMPIYEIPTLTEGDDK